MSHVYYPHGRRRGLSDGAKLAIGFGVAASVLAAAGTAMYAAVGGFDEPTSSPDICEVQTAQEAIYQRALDEAAQRGHTAPARPAALDRPCELAKNMGISFEEYKRQQGGRGAAAGSPLSAASAPTVR